MAKKKKSAVKKSVKKAKAPKKAAKKSRKVKAPKVVKQRPEPAPQDTPVMVQQVIPMSTEKASVTQAAPQPTNLAQVEKEINMAAEKGKDVPRPGFWARLFGKK